MGRYDTLIKCSQIKKLIEDNKYTKAFEVIKGLDLSRVHAISDLYMIAQVYQKADHFTEAKQIHYGIYERTHARRALYRLILLTIRMGDIKEARALYFEYEMAWGVTLDTYELRYRLARVEGAPRSTLISLLEDLRGEEFTEEWGYRLAQLYALDGEKEKCMEVCKDIVLWFGDGEIVDKAKKLLEDCGRSDWVPPEDNEYPSSVVKPEETVVPESARVQEMPEESEQEEEPTVEEPEESVESEESQESIQPTEPENVEEQKEDGATLEIPEDKIYISNNGLTYYTLKDTISLVQDRGEIANFAICGGEEQITMAIAKKLVKELNNIECFSAKTIAKISAEKLNRIDLKEKVKKLLGSCMLVLDAQESTPEALEQIGEVLDLYGEQLILILAGDFDEMDCWLSHHPEMVSRIGYKIKI